MKVKDETPISISTIIKQRSSLVDAEISPYPTVDMVVMIK